METLDHKYLNDLDIFAEVPPSSEHIARYIAEELDKTIDNNGVKVSKVCAWESANACAAYMPD